MRKLLVALFCASLLATGGGCTPAKPVTSAVYASLTAHKVGVAIVAAAIALEWTVSPIDEGTIEAKHFTNMRGLVVEIAYTATEYTIKYKDSWGMNYNEASQTVGRKYEQWTRNLNARIQRELARVSFD